MMKSTDTCSILPLFLALAFVGIAKAASLRFTTARNSNVLSSSLARDLVTKTTIECSEIRDEPYRGRLTLQYEYRVDTFQSVLLDVSAIEDALVQAVVAYLDTCDDRDRPMYAVEMADSHKVSTKGAFLLTHWKAHSNKQGDATR